MPHLTPLALCPALRPARRTRRGARLRMKSSIISAPYRRSRRSSAAGDCRAHRLSRPVMEKSIWAMFQMMGVFAEFERAIIRERVMSGLARAKAEGITLGRRALEQSEPKKIDAIKAALAAGMACGASRARTRQ